MLSFIMLMLRVACIYRSAECSYAECREAEYSYTKHGQT
jgi:hypothetical protein